FAEWALPDGQLRSAFGAELFEHDRGGGHAGFRDLSRGLAFGVAGAGEELTESSALERHRLAALLAGLVGERIFLGGGGAVCGRGLGQLSRILAFRLVRAGERLRAFSDRG